MSRTVNGERLLNAVAREMLRRQIWKVADYCGVEILTYAVLSNHFHVLIRIPQKQPIADAELLRRYRGLYGRSTPFQSAHSTAIEAILEQNGVEAQAWRQRQLARMGDVSQFMKLLKQRFSVWFNKTHQRFGTLWAERFKSVLVEAGGRALQSMAAYIDLNSVRGGLASDPMKYRFCGYAEAVAGNTQARRGIQTVLGEPNWKEAQSRYRETLFGTGASPRETAANISAEDLKRVIANGGSLPLAEILRCRVRYFTDGAVLGSRAFVETQVARYRQRAVANLDHSPSGLPAVADWDDLVVMRRLRGAALG